ncbi:unnamed protein product, partial [Musa textilis]
PARSKGVFIELFGFKNLAQKKSCPQFRTVGGTTAWHWRYYCLTQVVATTCQAVPPPAWGGTTTWVRSTGGAIAWVRRCYRRPLPETVWALPSAQYSPIKAQLAQYRSR